MVFVKICQGQLYSLYNDVKFSFSSDQLWAFGRTLLNCSHEHIHMKWMADLNDSSEKFVFILNGEKLLAMHNDSILKVRTVVIQNYFQT
jgi:hypothetical protein